MGDLRITNLDNLRTLKRLLDEAFRVPGTRFRFGWDAIIGLVPWAGDFITATKTEGHEWYELKPAVLGAIMEHFLSGQPVIEDGAAVAQEPAAEAAGEDSEVVRQIRELIETRVRPAVAQDGGDITLRGYDRGVVYLHLRGSCAGCPSSIVTLKNGIENLLRYYVPEVVEVRAIS